MFKFRSSERGQIVILLVVMLVGFLGLTALAIDGSMVYSDRRFAQNAADSSSLAGGGALLKALENAGISYSNFNCTAAASSMSQAVTAAIQRAAGNQFVIDNDISDKHGVRITCVNDPTHFDKHLDVEVKISSKTSTAFAHLVFGGELKNSVEAVTRVVPRRSWAFGYAITSTDEACANNVGGMVYEGNNTVTIDGGGVYTNSCLIGNGSIIVNLLNSSAGVNYISTYDGGGTFHPTPAKLTTEMPPIDIPEPNCNGLTDYGQHKNGGTISPGKYSSITNIGNGDNLVMQPGLYCITGDFEATGGSVTGNGVTIFITTGQFKITGGDIQLSAPTTNTSPAVRGLMLYLAKGNTSQVEMVGNGGSSYTGTVYVPDGKLDVGGSAGVLPTYNTELIGGYVKVHGNASININFNSPSVAQKNGLISLIK